MPPRRFPPPGKLLTAVVAGGIALALTACGAGTSSAGGGSDSGSATGQTLTLGLTQSGFVSFNPWASGNGINAALWYEVPVYDSLTRLNAAGQPVPSVATSWTVSGDTVTMQLRSGIKFSDGTPLDAAAVKANLDYGATHPSGGECNAYIEGMTTTVLSPTSVRLTLLHPAPGLLQDFAQCAGFIVSPKALANPSSLTSTPDGSGPYTLDKSATTIGTVYTYVKRPGYWDSAAYPWSKVVVTAFASTTAADNAARAGQLDGIQQVDPKDTSSGLTLVGTAPSTYAGLWFTDVTGAVVKALGNVQVRQAMNYAVNRSAIATAVYGKYAAVSGSSPFDSAYLGSSSTVDSTYSYDPAKAKQLLAAAGYSSGITIPTLVDPPDEQTAEAIAGYEQQVGINLQISVHSTDFITQMLTGKWPLVFGDYTLNPAQLQTLQGILGPDGFWNPRHNSDPTFNNLLTEIANASAKPAQESLYGQLAADAAAQAWTIAPVFIAQTSAWNLQKVKVTPITGVPDMLLYDIQPAS